MPPNIHWIDETQAEGELAGLYAEWLGNHPERKEVPQILKCFSQRPDFLRDIFAAADRVQFADGYLDRRTKETLATYASTLNDCDYCASSHAWRMQWHGEDDAVVAALRQGDLEAAPVSPALREMLRFVRLLTLHSSRCTPADIQRLRDAGWQDSQIAEAVYVTAMFALFNRVANAFGLEDPHYPPPTSEHDKS